MARIDKIYLDAGLWQRSIFRLRKGLENTFHCARADNISISTGFVHHNSCCYPTFYACYSLGQATRSKIFEIKTRFKEFGSQNCQNHFKVIKEPELNKIIVMKLQITLFFSASFSSEMAEVPSQSESRPSTVWVSIRID